MAGAGAAPTTITFDTDIAGWATTFSTPEGLMASSTLEHSAGAMMLTVPFSAADESVQVSFALPEPRASTGVISADVTLISGLTDDPMNPGGAFIFARSGASFSYAAGAWTNLDSDGPIRVSLDPSFPDFVDEANGTFDPSDLREIGISVATSGTATTVSEAVFLIDNVTY
jgi:hypothetical protein